MKIDGLNTEVLTLTFDNGVSVAVSGMDKLNELSADSTKGRLLKKYAAKEPQQFIQYDWCSLDGKCWAGGTTDLMQTLGVRVLIKPEVSGEDAVKALRDIADWIVKDGKHEPKSYGTGIEANDTDYDPFADE